MHAAADSNGAGSPAKPRIVVGVDGSADGSAAVRWASDQARWIGAELRVVTAFGPDHDFSGHDRAKEHMDGVIEQAVGNALAYAPNLTVTRVEHFGSPGTALCDESAEADLLVVGSRGRGGFAGLLLGSVSRQCAHRSACPVAVVRAADGEPADSTEAGAARSHRIVVGTDGSASSATAVAWAARQAEGTGATVEAVMAWDWMTTYGWGFVIPPDLDPRADSARTLEHELAPARAAHPAVVIESNLVEGPAAQLLVERSSDADLLVVGSRGHGGLVGAIIGSVSEYCVSHARCPVLVMHGPSVPFPPT